nr:MAG TPA: hypothetical protein [Caudoviricetes sp.]
MSSKVSPLFSRMRNARTMMRSFRLLFKVFIVLTSNQISHHKHKVVVCRFQSVHAPRHGFQLCLFLRFGGSGFFCLFLGFSLCGQLFGGVQDVPLNGHFLIPGGLRVNTGHIHHLTDITAFFATICVIVNCRGSVRQGLGLVVADLFHARHSIVMDGLGLLLEVAFCQVGVFDGVAVTVNDFHVCSFHAASSTRTQMYRA